jgi:hypothetical protein
VQKKGWPRVGQILANRVANVDTRIYPLYGDDAIDHWTKITDEEEEEDRSEDRSEDGSEGGSEARINVQARGEEEEGDQVRVNRDEEAGRGQIYHIQVRRGRDEEAVLEEERRRSVVSGDLKMSVEQF